MAPRCNELINQWEGIFIMEFILLELDHEARQWTDEELDNLDVINQWEMRN